MEHLVSDFGDVENPPSPAASDTAHMSAVVILGGTKDLTVGSDAQVMAWDGMTAAKQKASSNEDSCEQWNRFSSNCGVTYWPT